MSRPKRNPLVLTLGSALAVLALCAGAIDDRRRDRMHDEQTRRAEEAWTKRLESALDDRERTILEALKRLESMFEDSTGKQPSRNRPGADLANRRSALEGSP